MAVPTSAQCKLQLSFNMVDKTMTATVSAAVIAAAADNNIDFAIYYGVLTDPLGEELDIDEIGYVGGSGTPSQTWPAPVDADGVVLNGAYSIKVPFTVVDEGSPSTTYTDLDSDYTLNYTAPEVSLTAAIDCIAPSFTSNDVTDYRLTDPTSQGYITPTTVNYSHNLYYPVTSNDYPNNTTETNDLSIARGAYEFYQGTQTATVEHQVSYTFVDGLVVTDTIKGDLETKVDCATLMCGINCGLNTLYTTMQSNRISNNTLYLQQKSNYEFLAAIASNAQFNINCGETATSELQIAFLKAALGNCCNDCSTEDGQLICGSANPVFPFTPENVANKSTDIAADSGSNTKYPTVAAVENYAEPLLGFAPENIGNKSTDVALGGSNTFYPTQLAVKTYVDNNIPTAAYISYTANILGSGEADRLTITIMEDGIGSVVCTWGALGYWDLTKTGAFTLNKTWIMVAPNDVFYSVSAYRISANVIRVFCYDGTGTATNTLPLTGIEIRVYS